MKEKVEESEKQEDKGRLTQLPRNVSNYAMFLKPRCHLNLISTQYKGFLTKLLKS